MITTMKHHRIVSVCVVVALAASWLGCTPNFEDQLTNLDLNAIFLLLDDPTLTDEQRTDRLEQWGVTDPGLIALILALDD